MNKTNLLHDGSEQQIPQLCMDKEGLFAMPSPVPDIPNQDGGGQFCITRTYHDISRHEFLKVVEMFEPSLHGLFLAVANEDGFWQQFQKKAAEAFCKEGSESYVCNNPLFPLCFAYIDGMHHGYSRSLYSPHIERFYTLSDLAEIAQAVIGNKDMNNINKITIKGTS